MNRKRAIVFVALAVCIGFSASAQNAQFVFGPRVGALYVFSDWAAFNSRAQELFPDASRSYNPIMTQFGVNFEQRIRLGQTTSHFAFQEVLVFGGLDQNIVLPSLSALIGFRSRVGLEFGLGPNFSMTSSGGYPALAMSVVYAVGWTFSVSGVFVPVDIAFIPTPSDGAPRLSITSGFNFFIGSKE